MDLKSTAGNFLSYLSEAVQHALNTQMACESRVSAVSLKRQATFATDIAAVLQMTSSRYSGTLAMVFPASSFLNLYAAMVGETFAEINAENSDAAGEIINIVYGVARPKINKLGHDFTPALPSVLKGRDIAVCPAGTPLLYLLCESKAGPFELQFTLKEKAKAAA